MPLALLDTNVLVHATYRDAALFVPAAELVARGLRESGRYCIAPQNLVEFAAVTSRGRLVSPALGAEDVRRIVEQLFRSRCLRKIHPKRATVLRATLQGTALGLSGPAWYDLFLAQTMRDAGVEIIVTEDVHHFGRIPFVRTLRIAEAAAQP